MFIALIVSEDGTKEIHRELWESVVQNESCESAELRVIRKFLRILIQFFYEMSARISLRPTSIKCLHVCSKNISSYGSERSKSWLCFGMLQRLMLCRNQSRVCSNIHVIIFVYASSVTEFAHARPPTPCLDHGTWVPLTRKHAHMILSSRLQQIFLF